MPVQAPMLPGSFPNPSAIPMALRTLRDTPPPERGVLTAYLDTTPGQVSPQTYLLAFRDACRQVAAQLEPAARDAFEIAATRAERFLADLFVARHPGLALFVGPEADYLFAVPLPEPPHQTVAWGERPLLAQLEATLDEHEHVAVALVDRQRARLVTVFLGAIEEDQTVDSDSPSEAPVSGAGRDQPQARYVQRYMPTARLHGRGAPFVQGGVADMRRDQDTLVRRVRRTTSALVGLLRRAPFDRLFLAGSEDVVAMLRAELPRPLRARMAGTLSLPTSTSAAGVLRAAREAAEAVERRVEVGLVDELVAASTSARAVLGFTATLAALSEGRVYHLFVADTFDGIGSECGACARLVAGPGPCPACGSRTVPLLDPRERAVERALAQGARVEVVSGEAASLLLAHGGLGAWTRF